MVRLLIIAQLADANAAGATAPSRDPPAFRFRAARLVDAVHISRVEGLYTGWGIEQRSHRRLGDLALRVNAGWAWSERAARGRASAELTRGSWTFVARVARTLDITNDFRTARDSGATLSALFTVDNYDYVDRRLAAIGLARRFGQREHVWRLEVGPAHDAGVARTLRQGIFPRDSAFRENRQVRKGAYWRTWSTFEINPAVAISPTRAGVGAMFSVEHAIGTLDYARFEGRVIARRIRGPLTLAGRFDVGAVAGGALPPQQLYELGRNQGLQAYGFKEFVGDRATVGRALALMRLPLLQSRLPVRRWFIPAPTPALAVGVQGAWSTLSGSGARRANQELWQPLRSPTDGIRSSATLGMRFFHGAVGVGTARALNHGPWKLSVEFGQPL
jgi:hypothetical protein